MMSSRLSIQIINLAQDDFKREHTLAGLARAGVDLDLVKVFDAIDGRQLTPQAMSEIYIRLDKNDHLYTGRMLTSGELGCLLSHQAIYQQIQSDDIVLVLEDDIDVVGDLQGFLCHLDDLPPNWELVLLGNHVLHRRAACLSIWGRYAPGGFVLGKPVEESHGAYGYLINYRGAQKLLQRLQNFGVAPIDHYTGAVKLTNLYALQKPLIKYSSELLAHSNLHAERYSSYKAQIQGRRDPFIKRLLKRSILHKPLHHCKHALIYAKVRLKSLLPQRDYI